MHHLTKKLLPLLLIFMLLLAGCGGGGKGSGNAVNEGGGNAWIVADSEPIRLSAATPRTTGAEDWRDEIIYFIMTDRFYDGDRSNNGSFYNKRNINYYHGGDLQGIIDHVDYLRRLGVTSIWITPVVENVWRDPHYSDYTGYHGYWARDFSKLDPHLGSSTSTYQNFINTMHNNGILVIQDIVVNHMGPLAAYTAGWTPPYSSSGYTRAWAENLISGNATNYNYLKPTESPFNDLNSFHNYGQISNYDDTTQLTEGDCGDLPDLNTENAAVKNELISAYQAWAGLGVDGFRIDTAKHVNKDFWADFCSAIRSNSTVNHFFQFGEVWIGYHPSMAAYLTSGGMDSLLNYDLYYVMLGVFANDGEHTNATHALTEELNRRSSSYSTTASSGTGLPPADCLVNFIDNHDNKRFLSSAGGNLDRMWLALTYLMTTKGIPCIYYNTENAITGKNSDAGRQDMPNFETVNKRTFTLIRVLSKIRQENSALRRGNIQVLKDSSGAGIFAFVRSGESSDENVFVLLNTSGSAITETIPVEEYSSDGTVLRNILYSEFGKIESITVTSHAITVNLPAYSMKIFKK